MKTPVYFFASARFLCNVDLSESDAHVLSEEWRVTQQGKDPTPQNVAMPTPSGNMLVLFPIVVNGDRRIATNTPDAALEMAAA